MNFVFLYTYIYIYIFAVGWFPASDRSPKSKRRDASRIGPGRVAPRDGAAADGGQAPAQALRGPGG